MSAERTRGHRKVFRRHTGIRRSSLPGCVKRGELGSSGEFSKIHPASLNQASASDRDGSLFGKGGREKQGKKAKRAKYPKQLGRAGLHNNNQEPRKEVSEALGMGFIACTLASSTGRSAFQRVSAMMWCPAAVGWI